MAAPRFPADEVSTRMMRPNGMVANILSVEPRGGRMFIPIGHSETSVRRWPWVTFAIMGLCLVAFLVTRPGTSAAGREAHFALEAIKAFYMLHPELELDPRVEDQVFEGMPNRQGERDAMKEFLKESQGQGSGSEDSRMTGTGFPPPNSRRNWTNSRNGTWTLRPPTPTRSSGSFPPIPSPPPGSPTCSCTGDGAI
jgi:hypothetical protein